MNAHTYSLHTLMRVCPLLLWLLQQTDSPAIKPEGWTEGAEEGAGTHHKPLLTAHRPARSPLHPPPSDTRKGPPAEALPAGQTLRPAEHKGWVNSSLAFFSGPTLRVEAETNAGRIPGLWHRVINSSDQQGNNAHS